MSNRSLVEIFTDGSVRPKNPGNGGSCGLIRVKDKILITGRHIGPKVTNNRSELEAIDMALGMLIDYSKELKIRIDKIKVNLYSDSKYSLGVIAGQWKISKNASIIYRIRNKLNKIPNINLMWVKAHRKAHLEKDEDILHLITWNNVADRVAKHASATKNYYWSCSMKEEDFLKEFNKTKWNIK